MRYGPAPAQYAETLLRPTPLRAMIHRGGRRQRHRTLPNGDVAVQLEPIVVDGIAIWQRWAKEVQTRTIPIFTVTLNLLSSDLSTFPRLLSEK